MALYHFLENTKVYLQLSSGLVHKLDITPEGVNFSQTFTETTLEEKTLQSQTSLIKTGVFKKANPASFSFTVPLLKENDFDFLFNLLVDLNTSNTLDTFNLFFINENKVFTLETCVLQSGNFVIDRIKPLAMQLSGQASKLVASKSKREICSATGIVDFSGIAQIGGLSFTNSQVQPRSKTRTFLPLTEAQVQYNNEYGTSGGAEKEALQSVNIELQNNISWINNRTITGSINTTNSYNVVYPTNFTLNDRSLAGSASFFIPTHSPDNDSNFTDSYSTGLNQKFVENQKLRLSAFSRVGGSNYGIEFSDIVNYTSRVNSAGGFFTMNLDWRLARNTNAISSIFKYITFSDKGANKTVLPSYSNLGSSSGTQTESESSGGYGGGY